MMKKFTFQQLTDQMFGSTNNVFFGFTKFAPAKTNFGAGAFFVDSTFYISVEDFKPDGFPQTEFFNRLKRLDEFFSGIERYFSEKGFTADFSVTFAVETEIGFDENAKSGFETFVKNFFNSASFENFKFSSAGVGFGDETTGLKPAGNFKAIDINDDTSFDQFDFSNVIEFFFYDAVQQDFAPSHHFGFTSSTLKVA